MLTVVAFVLAIALLVAVHEWGHFAMARYCGVRVLRFSVGFGPKLFGWKSAQTGTEFVVCALPIGGYVKMLDEREGTVEKELRAFAFNTQALKKRAAIVAAGPLANLLLAAILYAVVNWMGVEQAEALLSRPVANSIAQKAGFQGGERVVAVSLENEEVLAVDSFEDFRWLLTQAALAQRDLTVEYRQGDGVLQKKTLLLSSIDVRTADSILFRAIGFASPYSPAQIGDVVPGGGAERAGLQRGDVVMSVSGMPVVDANQLREHIRASVVGGLALPQVWQIKRGNALTSVELTPAVVQEGELKIGRVGAVIGATPSMVTVRYGFIDGIHRSLNRTWEVSILTLKMMGRIATGQSSIKNLSGPLTIADYAGKSASMGMTQFAIFLALVSISLGVLNLLPLPVLDGGHLMYYLWEYLVGRPLSDAWTERLQRVGLAVLMMMMSIAVFNDVTRLLA